METEQTPLLTSRQRRMSMSSSLQKTHLVLYSSWANVLLISLPFAFLSYFLNWSSTAVFIFNFFSIIPLAALLSFATDELTAHVGESIGGLVNVTFGNAVELIIAIVALYRGQIRIVQTSMLGSILSNILLVTGCCFLAGGWNRVQQKFNLTAAQTMASLMALSGTSLMIPAAFYAAQPEDFTDVLLLSRGTSIILLAIYFFFLVFQLKTHANFFEAQKDHDSATVFDSSRFNGDLEASNSDTLTSYSQFGSFSTNNEVPSSPVSTLVPTLHLGKWESVTLLAIISIIVSFCADFLVSSIDDTVSHTGISKTFIGIILIPIVGNAAEHAMAVICAMRDKMDMAVGVAIGSSMQIALFLTPFLVILGWIIGQPMSLLFSTFETAVLFISVMLLNYIVNDGESNWLEGTLLLGTYIIISIAFFCTS